MICDDLGPMRGLWLLFFIYRDVLGISAHCFIFGVLFLFNSFTLNDGISGRIGSHEIVTICNNENFAISQLIVEPWHPDSARHIGSIHVKVAISSDQIDRSEPGC
jgi:hypothetical protein